MIKLDLLHKDFPDQRWAEIRFDIHAPLGTIKDKIYRHVGTSPATMRLFLVSDTGETVGELQDDLKSLSDLGVTAGQSLLVEDLDPSAIGKQLGADLAALPPAYKMSEEAYNSRPQNARKFISGLKDSRPELFEKSAAPGNPGSGTEVAEVRIGSRCSVAPGDRRGVIRAIIQPETNGESRVLVGVALDEPQGTCDGTFAGRKLFSCGGPKYGVWVALGDLLVGDYPEFDPFAVDEI